MLIHKDGLVAHFKDVFSGFSFPSSGPTDEFLSANGAQKVNLFLAHDQRTQKLVACDPYIQDGWAYTVRVESKTDEELAADTASQAARVRSDRTRRLAESDWTQGKDIADNVSTIWATYRQALRDITTQAGFPWDVQWPAQPE